MFLKFHLCVLFTDILVFKSVMTMTSGYGGYRNQSGEYSSGRSNGYNGGYNNESSHGRSNGYASGGYNGGNTSYNMAPRVNAYAGNASNDYPSNEHLGGRKGRQVDQDRKKHDKSFREAEFFWYSQERNAESDKMRGGPPRKGNRRLDEEEAEIFKGGNHGSVGIAFDSYDDIPVERTGNEIDEIPVITSFAEIFEIFAMPEFVQKNVQLLGYTRPTPVQKYAMSAGLCGRDLMTCAQTGSGKTATFIVPIVGILDRETAVENMKESFLGAAAPRAVILAPTRELCSQIFNEAIKFTHRSPFRVVQIYGGVDAKVQLTQLTRGVDILVATPGRLTDFIDRGVMTMSKIQILVLDEADRMLDMGFEPQIRTIVQDRDMPSQRQTMMFSATFPKEIQKLAADFLHDYVWVCVGRVGGAADTVEQSFLKLQQHEKQQALLEILEANKDQLTLVFVAKKRTASWLCQYMRRQGNIQDCAEIHGDLSQNERERALSMFRSQQCKVLVATDVAARGLDIPMVNLVINYDLPMNIDDYVHRIGRTGRIGHKGKAIGFYVSSLDDPTGGNSAILKELVEVLEGTTTNTVPAFMSEEYAQKFARQNNAQRRMPGGKGAFGFGGRDIRNGQYGAARTGKGHGKGGRPTTDRPRAGPQGI